MRQKFKIIKKFIFDRLRPPFFDGILLKMLEKIN